MAAYEMATCLVHDRAGAAVDHDPVAPGRMEKARQLIDSDSLLHAMGKARLLDAQKMRVQRYAPAAAPKQIAASAVI